MPQKDSEKASLYLLDGHSLAYRAFFALPLDLTTAQGQHTGAVLGFLNMLLRLEKTAAPEYLAVVFDYPSPTFRHEKYREYKATREKTPQELREQFPLIKEVLDALSIPWFELEGYEADDLIGAFTLQGEEAGLNSVIVTGDADVYQLISSKVKILITRKGISNLAEITPEQLLQDYGLTPDQWIDYKALKGDSSDNIPGVPGIGEKRALQLLHEFGSLDETLKHAHEIKGKLGENLSNNTSQALLSRDLVTIRREIPLKLPWEKCRRRNPDTEALYKIFTRLEFNNLLKRIPEIAASVAGVGPKPATSGVEADPAATGGTQREVPPAEAEGLRQISLLDGVRRENQQQISMSDEKWQKQAYGDYAGEGKGMSPCADNKIRALTGQNELDVLQSRLTEVTSFAILLSMEEETVSPKQNQNICRGLFLSLPGDDPVFIPFSGDNSRDGQVVLFFRNVFANSGLRLVTHDLKPLLKLLWSFDLELKCPVFDTLLAAYLLETDKASYHPHLLVEDYLGKKFPLPGKKVSEEEHKEQIMLSLSESARNLHPLSKIFSRKLEQYKLEQLYYELELPLVPVLARMEMRGVKADKEVFRELAGEMETELTGLHQEITEMAGEEFNLNSPQQLSYILFEKLKLPASRKTKTGFSTDARVLQELAGIHPIASKLCAYRSVTKLKNTYLEGLYPYINEFTGKIHPTFNQAVTATGRLSCKDPNLQNIPVKMESGRRLRRAFIPSEKGWLLLAADYSQIELRIMAHLSQDPNLIRAFINNEDIHTSTAAEVFGVAPEDVTSLMRGRAKAVNFGIIYGISDYGLSKDLQIPRAEAAKYIEQYFQRYPGVKSFMEECIKQAGEKGYISTILNRRRYIPDIKHHNFTRRSVAERIAMNTPVQGSAADIIKAAMVAIDIDLQKDGGGAAMLLQVHDELIFEVAPGEMNNVSMMVKKKMEDIVPLSVPLKVDIKQGKDWYNLTKIQLRNKN